MEDMKTLLENWRHYSNIIETSEDFGSVYLRENKQVVKKDFGSLLERFDSGTLSKKSLYEKWHASMLYEHKLLLEEIGIDWEKEAEMLDDPDYKPPQERPGKISQALEKIGDFFLKKSIQIFQMAKRGVEAAIFAAASLAQKAKQFAKKYPLLTRVIVIVCIAVAMYALMAALDPSEASAKIKAQSEISPYSSGLHDSSGNLTSRAYEALRGLIHSSKDPDLGGVDWKIRGEAMKLLDEAQRFDGDPVDFSTMTTQYGKFVYEKQLQLENVFRVEETSPDVYESRKYYGIIKTLINIGENVTYEVMGKLTR